MEAITMYSVKVDKNNCLIDIKLTGFWSNRTMSDYVSTLNNEFRQIGSSGRGLRIIVDMSDYPVQSVEVVQKHANLMDHGTRVMGAKIAIILKSALARMQATRLVANQGQRSFTSKSLALAWLLESDETPNYDSTRID
jgi:hypothetical protein